MDRAMRVVRNTVEPGDLGKASVLYYSIPAIQETGGPVVEEAGSIESGKLALRGGELLVSRLNPRKGCIALVRRDELPILGSTEFVALVPVHGDLKYCYYVYSSHVVREQLSAVVKSVTRSHQRAQPEDITKLWWFFPPREEQRAIADFLDRETAKIDALVAKKRRLIELLQEKRTALISHAVNRA